MSPGNVAHRKMMLSAAWAIGVKHKEEFLKYKPQILKLDEDPGLKETTGPIIDFMEGRR